MTDKVTIQINAQNNASPVFRTLTQDAQKAGTSLEQAGDKGGKAFAGLNKAGALWGAVGGTVVDVAREATAAFAESEAVQARLQSAIENAGQSFDDYKTRIKEAGDAAVQLGFDDEEASAALATLTQATGDAGAALNDLQMVEDLARAKNMSLADAAKIVADAEAGRMRGLVGLGLGIDATMSKEQAFAIITGKTAGAADAFAETSAGAAARLKAEMGNALEWLGGKIQAFGPYLNLTAGSFKVLGAAVGALAPEFSLINTLQGAYASLTGSTAVASEAAAAGLVAEGAAGEVAAVGMETAAVASTGLMASLGPVGLALMAAGAVAALFLLRDSQDDVRKSTEDLEKAESNLATTIMNLGVAAGATAEQQSLLATINSITRSSANATDAMGKYYDYLNETANASTTSAVAFQNVNNQLTTTDAKLSGLLPLIQNTAGGQELLNQAMAASSDGGADITYRELANIIGILGQTSQDTTTQLKTTDDILNQANSTGQDTTKIYKEVAAAWQAYDEAMVAAAQDGVVTDEERAAALNNLSGALSGIQTDMNNTSVAQGKLNEETQKYIDLLQKQRDAADETWLAIVTGAEGTDEAIKHIFSSTADGADAMQQKAKEAMDKLQAALNDGDQSNDIAALKEYNATIDQIDTSVTILEGHQRDQTATAIAGATAQQQGAQLQAQATLEAAEASKTAAEATKTYSEGQVQAATVATQAAQLQAQTSLEVATAAGGTVDALEGQAAATDALAQGQRLQSQTALDNAKANGSLPPTLAEITIKLQDMRGAIDDARTGVGEIDKGMAHFVSSIKATNPAMASLDKNLAFLADSSVEVQDEVVQLYDDFEHGKITAQEFADKVQTLTDSEEQNRGTTADAAASAKDLQKAWEDASTAAGKLVLQLDTLVAGLVAMGDATAAQELAYNLNLANTAADDLRRVIIQLPDGIASAAQQTKSWADELINVRGQYGRIDDLLAKYRDGGLFTQEDYDAAQNAYDSLVVSTQAIQDYTDIIQAKLVPYLADAQESQAKYLETLAGQPAASQMAALGYMDQAESAKALAAAQLMASAAGTDNEESTRKQIEAMAAADPVLKAMLIDMGLIKDNGDGTITVDFDKADATVATLDDVVDAVTTLSAVLAQAFHLDINHDGIDDATQSVEELIGQTDKAKTSADALKTAADVIPPSVAVTIPIATPTGEDPATQLQAIKTAQDEVNKGSTDIKVDDHQVVTASSEVTKLQTKLDALDNDTWATHVDDKLILDAWSAAGWLDDKLDAVDDNYARPTVDDGEIWSAWTAADNLLDKLNALDGRHVTVTVDVVQNGSVPDGSGPSALGGVMGYARGGMVTGRMGENGPEALDFPNGRRGLALTDGLYTVPRGTYVHTADRTRDMAGKGLTVNVNVGGNVIGVDDLALQVSRQLAPAVARAFGDHYNGQGW